MATNKNLLSFILQLLIPLFFSIMKDMFHDSTIYLKNKKQISQLNQSVQKLGLIALFLWHPFRGLTDVFH